MQQNQNSSFLFVFYNMNEAGEKITGFGGIFMFKAIHLHFPRYFSTIRAKFLFICLMICCLSFLAFLSLHLYSSKALKEQTLSNTNDTLAVYQQWMDYELEHVSSYLLTSISSHASDRLLFEGNTAENYQAQLSLMQDMGSFLTTYKNIGGLFFYVPKTDTLIMKSQKKESYSHRLALQQYIEQYQMEDSSSSSKAQIAYWYPVSIQGKVFLMEILYYRQTYMGAWITDTQLLEPFRQLNLFENNTFLLSDTSSPSDWFLLTEQDLSEESYIYSYSDSSCGNFRMTLCIPEEDFFQKTMPFRHIFYWLCAVSFLLLCVTMFLLFRQIFPPLHRMLVGILAVKQGDFSTQIPLPSTQDEFTQVTTAFNEMIQEIQTLKVKVYEEKLEKTNTQIQYLTLQIKPHFFLNSLNMICSMVATKHYDLITEMATGLIHYFRYAFKSAEELAPIKEELEHTKNFLHIQELRLAAQFQFSYQIHGQLDDIQIPILTIQTFVENNIKHGFNRKRELSICIDLYCHKDFTDIYIKDNGPGFSQTLLEQLNTDAHSLDLSPLINTVSGESHIGIENVKRRLYHIYHGKACLKFFNHSDTGGAVVLIHLPSVSQRRDLL